MRKKIFDRITEDPGKMNGQLCIRGMRVPLKTIVRMVAGGMSVAEIVAEHPDLEEDDVRQALEFAAASSEADS